jgi:hypothetical protein
MLENMHPIVESADCLAAFHLAALRSIYMQKIKLK